MELKLEKKKIRNLEELRTFLEDYFAGRKIQVYLFGSRARGDNRSCSDIDLALASDVDLSMDIALINYYLEESDLPYKVDLVEYKKMSEKLQESIIKEGVLWIERK